MPWVVRLLALSDCQVTLPSNQVTSHCGLLPSAAILASKLPVLSSTSFVVMPVCCWNAFVASESEPCAEYTVNPADLSHVRVVEVGVDPPLLDGVGVVPPGELLPHALSATT